MSMLARKAIGTIAKHTVYLEIYFNTFTVIGALLSAVVVGKPL